MTDKQILNLFEDCNFEYGISYSNFESTIFQYLPEDFSFDWNYGVSKLVLIPDDADYVIKIPFLGKGRKCEDRYRYANDCGGHEWDYCFTEVMYYHIAKSKYRVGEFFAKPRFIGYIHDYPIYVQQKVETFSSLYGSSTHYKMDNSEESKRRQNTVASVCESTGTGMFNMKWLTDALEYYGEKRFNDFMEFISMLDDFHDQNVGYLGDKPVILDFSDWND